MEAIQMTSVYALDYFGAIGRLPAKYHTPTMLVCIPASDLPMVLEFTGLSPIEYGQLRCAATGSTERIKS